MFRYLLASLALIVVLALAWQLRADPAPTDAVVNQPRAIAQPGLAGDVATVSQPVAAAAPARRQSLPPIDPVSTPVNAYVKSPSDSGATPAQAAVTEFLGPDGKMHPMPPANPELQYAGDPDVRAAVMEEIKSDPTAFAAAIGAEVADVERVASGEQTIPEDWIIKMK